MRKIDWKVAFAALGLHWLAVIAAYCVMRATTPGTGTLLAMLEARFTTAGDAPHYLFLATEGYQATGEQANLIVFYPLYPLLMRLCPSSPATPPFPASSYRRYLFPRPA